jgi:pimeloyl-ACP methyl ester carboxylesterase
MEAKLRDQLIRSADGTGIAVHTLGAGPELVVLGGAVRTGQDYLPLARGLARRYRVHVVDRRGHGGSGPQGPDYGMDREVEDLTAVLAATGARRVVAHSYGGLVALETAKRSDVLTELVLYEPGVSVGGRIPVGWIPRFEERLQRGDELGAFAEFVRGSGQVPPLVAHLPVAYFRIVLRLVLGRRGWARTAPMMPTIAPEHREVARLDDSWRGYAAVAARTLLLGGSRSAAYLLDALAVLDATLPHAEMRILEGLDHLAPEKRGAEAVAAAALAHLSA